MARACIYSFPGSDNASVALTQSPAGAGALTLVSPTVTFPNRSVHVGITAISGNWSTVTFGIFGINENGEAISEGHAGPVTGTVFTTALFKTVTSVTVSGTVAGGSISVGSGPGVTDWCLMNTNNAYAGFAVQVNVSDGFTYTVEKTLFLNQGYALPGLQSLAFPFDPAHVGQTSDGYFVSSGSPIAGIRVNFSAVPVGDPGTHTDIIIVQQGIV